MPFRFLAYLSYLYHAKSRFTVQSPFVTNLCERALVNKKSFKRTYIEGVRKKLLRNHTLIEVVDHKSSLTKRKTISSEARTSLSSSHFMMFLAALCDFLKVSKVLETGTSFGLTSLYLSSVPTLKKIITIEGSHTLAGIAQQHFTDYDFEKKIELMQGDIYDQFIPSLVRLKPELVFLDADHRPEALDFYLESIEEHGENVSCIVIHDIYWSKNMNDCWRGLIEKTKYSLSIDLFHVGLLFPKRSMEKQHFILHF